MGSSTPQSFNITVPGGSAPVDVTVQNATFAAPLNDFSGVSRFLVTGNLTLTASNALGGASGTSPTHVEILSGGSLSVANATAVNSNVLLHANSTLQLGAALSGTGIFSRDNAPMGFVVNSINGLTGTQITPSFIQPGDTVTLPTNNVLNLQSLPAGNYIFPANGGVSTSGNAGSYIAFSQAAGLNVNGGSIRFLNTSQNRLVEGPLAQGDSTLHVGPAGATISAPGSAPGVNTPIFSGATIDVRIVAQGPVTIGGAPANGTVAFTNSLNTLSTINVNAPFVATIPGAVNGAAINLNGSLLYLLGTAVLSGPVPPVTYPNTINVHGNSTISFSLPTGSQLPFQSFAISTYGPINIGAINVGAANITLLGVSQLGTLNISGNGTLQLNSPLSVGPITDDGNPHSISIAAPLGTTSNISIVGNSTTTAALSFSNVAVEVDGAISRSTAAVSISNGALAGNCIIQRPVIFSNSGTTQLAPGTGTFSGRTLLSSLPGTMTLDSLVLASSTQLRWDLGAPNSSSDDLVIVNGNLTLDGTLSIAQHIGFGPGTYTLLDYTGSLTNNILNLPTMAGDALSLDLSTPGQVNLIVTAVPEPASLALLSLPLGILLSRRSRDRRADRL